MTKSEWQAYWGLDDNEMADLEACLRENDYKILEIRRK